MTNQEKDFTRRDYEEALEISNWAMDNLADSILIGTYEMEFEKVEKAQQTIKQALQDKIASFEERE